MFMAADIGREMHDGCMTMYANKLSSAMTSAGKSAESSALHSPIARGRRGEETPT